MVIFAIGRNRTGTMMTFTNIFLSNLALMDLLRVVFCMPSAVILDVTENWYLGTSMCKIIAFIEVFTIFVSELTLSYIAYDRWKCLQDPFKPSELSSVQRPKIVILLMWTLAAILSLPEPFMSAVMSSSSSVEISKETIRPLNMQRWLQQRQLVHVTGQGKQMLFMSSSRSHFLFSVRCFSC